MPGEADEVGALKTVGEETVLAALKLVKRGRIFDLDPGRFPGMPVWPGHPAFQVLTYRSPAGITATRDVPGLAENVNVIRQFPIVDLLICTMHSGAHIDALAHHAVGEDHHWYGGYTAREYLGDFGPTKADISAVPPIVLRGVLIDVPAAKGVERLKSGYGITVSDLREALGKQDIALMPKDAVLIRTGLMAVWPDEKRIGETEGAGIDLPAAKWLVEEGGAVFLGSDTSVLEQQPSVVPGVPSPVHAYLLTEQGIHVGEYFFLEDLAREKVYEFALVVLPLKVRGGTASLVRPIAIV